jgi:hypothetical protein
MDFPNEPCGVNFVVQHHEHTLAGGAATVLAMRQPGNANRTWPEKCGPMIRRRNPSPHYVSVPLQPTSIRRKRGLTQPLASQVTVP